MSKHDEQETRPTISKSAVQSIVMPEAIEQLKRDWLHAIELIDETREILPTTWKVQVGDVVLTNIKHPRNRFMKVEKTEVIFFNRGFPEFEATGKILDDDGNKTDETGSYAEGIEDGWHDA